jgi:uncharacterized protein
VTIVVLHLVAVYAVVAAPWLSYVVYQKARRRMQAGDPLARIKLYRVIVADQVISTGVLLWIWLSGGISGARLGLGAPRSWWLSAGLALALGGFLVWRSIRLRPKAEKIREKLKGRAEALIPATFAEGRWFAAVSVGAGISEELIFRGFLFYYLSFWFPHVNSLECVLITSVFFGVGHLYQGWKGVLSTGLAGLILAVFYVLSGNLLLPMVVHAVVDLQGAFLFWPATGPRPAELAA